MKNLKNNKKGLSLATLVITVIISLILVTVSVVSVSSALNNAKKASFAEELTQIEDQTLLYYLQNGEEYPAYTNSDETYVTKTPSEIKSIVGDKKFNELKEEMKQNKENGEEDITDGTQLAFYEIDLDKLAIEDKTRGIKKDGKAEDVYILSAKTNRVYYLKGLKAGTKTYYSLANLMNYSNKVISNVEENIEITEVGALTVKRAKKTWTNTMGITLSVKDTLSGTISAKLKDGETEIASSNFTLKSEYVINSLNDLPGTSFSSTQKDNFNKSKNKKIEFTKGTDTVVIDMSNYDVLSPTVDLNNLTKNILENGNILTFKVSDTQSGIKEVKYDYLKKYDENGDIQNYYKDTTTLEPSFIKARGKKAEISAPDENGNITVTIKVPFDIEGIQLYVGDKAGNYTTSTIGIYDFANDPYIGCKLKSITNVGLTFKTVFNTNDSSKKLTKYTVKVSTDNTTFSGDYSETLATSKEKYSKLVETYKKGLEIEKKAYVKITATIAGVAYERIFEFDISDGSKIENEENIEDGSMIKTDNEVLSAEEYFLNSGVKRGDITNISFEKNVIPETYVSKFDASLECDNSIIGYVIQEHEYSISRDIVFSSDKTIYANWDSSDFFAYLDTIVSINFNNFDTSKAKNMSGMFKYCSSDWVSAQSINLDLSGFDTSNVTDMSNMFYGFEWLNSVKSSRSIETKVNNMSYMFYNCSNLTSVDVSSLDTSNVTNMSGMFEYCSSLTNLDVSNFNTSNVTDMCDMFGGCSGLTNLDVSKFNTSNATNMSGMFSGCSKLTSIDVSNFNTSNVTNTSKMFEYCSGLTSVDVSSLDTSNVTNMSGMFSGCSKLTSIDVSNFNTSKVTSMANMFCNLRSLKTIYASDKFNTNNATVSGGMFDSCISLVGGNGTKYNSSYKDKTYARIDKDGQKGYFTLK